MAVSRGLLAIPLFCLATTAGAQFPPSGFEIGAPFPALQFQDARTGQLASVQDQRGTKLLVAIFASW